MWSPSRRHTLLPLDDCLYALQASIPQLTRLSLHRCFQRHGISRVPEGAGSKPRKAFEDQPLGFHIEITEVRTEEGKLHLFSPSTAQKFASAELHERATRRVAADFLRCLIATVPYRIHTGLTDNGTHFTDPGAGGSPVPEIIAALETGEIFRAHAFELACARARIEHRLTRPNHPGPTARSSA